MGFKLLIILPQCSYLKCLLLSHGSPGGKDPQPSKFPHYTLTCYLPTQYEASGQAGSLKTCSQCWMFKVCCWLMLLGSACGKVRLCICVCCHTEWWAFSTWHLPSFPLPHAALSLPLLLALSPGLSWCFLLARWWVGSNKLSWSKSHFLILSNVCFESKFPVKILDLVFS